MAPTAGNAAEYGINGHSRIEFIRCDSCNECHKPSNCTSGQFTCNSGRCINEILRCNEDYDCSDNSDENGCTNTTAACKFGKPIEEVQYIQSTEEGTHRLSQQTAASVLSNRYFGSCKVVHDGKHFRLPHNFDRYQHTNGEIGWNTRKFDSFGLLVEYMVRNMSSHILHGDLYNVLNSTDKNENYYLAEYLYTIDNIVLKISTELQLSTEYTEALKHIPKTANYEKYFGIFDMFGTDYVTRGNRGGHLIIVQSISKCEQQPEFIEVTGSLTFPKWTEDRRLKTLTL